MTLDESTVLVVTALVVNVAGVLFIVETLIRRDEGAGRIWALAFLAGMLATASYSVWSFTEGVWWAIAAGNAAFVAAIGCIWLGNRSFNRHALVLAASGVAFAAVGAAASALLPGPDGGPWAGAPWMFVSLILLSGLGAAESVRGAMGRTRTAWTLAAALGFVGFFNIARMSAFSVSGPESPVFTEWFGTVTASLLTVILTIVAVVVTSVLRAGRATLRGYSDIAGVDSAGGGILSEATFQGAWAGLCDRASARGELVGAIAVRIEDLEEISTAFGSEVARTVTEVWRGGVRRYAPSNAYVGDDGPTGLLVGIITSSPADARRDAALIYRGLFEGLGSITGGVLPIVGVGVGLSDTGGYEPGALIRSARDAARRAALSVETSVLIGDSEG